MDVRKFPLQTSPRERYASGATQPHPLEIPWSVAEKAYSVYVAQYGRGQSLERLAARGGFSGGEMDELYPGWRDEISAIAAARAEGVREGQRQVDRELLRKVAEAVAGDCLISSSAFVSEADRERTIDRCIAEHTQPAPAESEYPNCKCCGKLWQDCPCPQIETAKLKDEYRRGVREEREACARLAETHIDKHAGAPDGGSFCVHHIVRDIRARSQDAAAQDERGEGE